MNTELRRNGKERLFSKLMNNAGFGKTMESIGKDREKYREERRYHLVSEPKYHVTKCFSENFLEIEKQKRK